MKKIFLFFLCFSKLMAAEEVAQTDFLKGIHSITVYTQISPHPLDVAFESVLEKVLSNTGKVVSLRLSQSLDNNFYSAISNDVFLKLSLENWVVESVNDAKKQFKVEIHLVLECIKKSSENNRDRQLIGSWVAEEVFDFSSDDQNLINIGKKATNDLINQFLDAYHKENKKTKDGLTFYIL